MKKTLVSLVSLLTMIGSVIYAEKSDFIISDIENGTITVYSQDMNYGITIQDKNIGAENIGEYGYYYQWGNNHGNYAGTNTGNLNELLEADVNDWINLGYNGYNNNFIIFNNGNKSTYDYRSGVYYTDINDNSYIGESQYNNLWGGKNDNDDSNATIIKGYNKINYVATNTNNRRGPCGEGYHVPTAGEWQELMMLRCNANSDICSGNIIGIQNGEYDWANYLSGNGIGTIFSSDLSLPLAGYRSYRDGSVYGQENDAYYWSSSPRGGSYPKDAWYLYFDSNNVYSNYGSYRAYGQLIRCFKNSYIKIPKILNISFISENVEVGTGEVTENMTGTIPEKATNLINTGYIFEYRYLSGGDATTLFDFENTPISGSWSDENNNIYFIAKWTPIIYSVQFTGIDMAGTMEIQNFIYAVTQNLMTNNFTKTGYSFSGWRDGTTRYIDGQSVVNLTTISGDLITLIAERTPILYSISFDTDGGSEVADITGYYNDDVIAPQAPRKAGYTFSGWDRELVTKMPAYNTGYKALRIENKIHSGGSSGGGSNKNSNETGTNIQKEDKSSTDTENIIQSEINLVQVSGVKNDESNDILMEYSAEKSDSEGQLYSTEFQQAYEFAYEKGITTMPSIHKANMNGKLTRIAMAKMLSYYAINVLGQKPDKTRNNKFNDVSEELDFKYNNGVTLAYQLGIMGINMINNNFRPHDEVTRAEFATALSRMLYSTPDGNPYYITHLEKLKEEGIITNDDPKMKELRAYVMIMLMRSAK